MTCWFGIGEWSLIVFSFRCLRSTRILIFPSFLGLTKMLDAPWVSVLQRMSASRNFLIFSFSAGISLCPIWYAGIVGCFCGSFSLILWLMFLIGGSVSGTVS